MKISATSALVLNWTDHKLWQRSEAIAYNSQLDLSEGEELFKLFSEDETYMHRQTVSGRKYFMKKNIFAFLQKYQDLNIDAQVIILAAGLAPLSVEIASEFPSCKVFDIDKYSMEDKKKLVNGNPNNIEFINCDITDLMELNEKLLKRNFNKNKPTIAVLEGIIYYLRLDDIKNIIHFLYQNNASLACEFGIEPDLVNMKTSVYITEVFRKIKEEVGLDFINYYSESEFCSILKDVGYKSIISTNMQQIQKERTGSIHPFVTEDSAWLMNIYAE